MTWSGDVCGLVDEFRSGRLHPVEVMRETLSAIGASDLNAFSFINEDGALAPGRESVGRAIFPNNRIPGFPNRHASAIYGHECGCERLQHGC